MKAIDFPEIVSLHVDKTIPKPFSTEVAKRTQEEQYKGIVSADGKWIQEPAAGWKVELTEPGYYVITHNHGHPTYGVNISLFGIPGNIQVEKMNEYVVEISVKGEESVPMNADFLICMSITQRVIKGAGEV